MRENAKLTATKFGGRTPPFTGENVTVIYFAKMPISTVRARMAFLYNVPPNLAVTIMENKVTGALLLFCIKWRYRWKFFGTRTAIYFAVNYKFSSKEEYFERCA
jgi:hypothetical protein